MLVCLVGFLCTSYCLVSDSLIGKLNFACHIIHAARIFLRRIIDLSCTVRLPHHHLTLNKEAHRDIAWWLEFLPTWNGRDIIPDPQWLHSPNLELFTDASGCLGYGIYYMGNWIAQPWPAVLQDRSIQEGALLHCSGLPPMELPEVREETSVSL